MARSVTILRALTVTELLKGRSVWACRERICGQNKDSEFVGQIILYYIINYIILYYIILYMLCYYMISNDIIQYNVL